ncbi:hypothetical protein ZWY2020_038651 [Hordeum vulgare]|nr:hypothetical protein ZWY2020_038651 [Hordeum vulgare]
MHDHPLNIPLPPIVQRRRPTDDQAKTKTRRRRSFRSTFHPPDLTAIPVFSAPLAFPAGHRTSARRPTCRSRRVHVTDSAVIFTLRNPAAFAAECWTPMPMVILTTFWRSGALRSPVTIQVSIQPRRRANDNAGH